jgi:hypothetical protein
MGVVEGFSCAKFTHLPIISANLPLCGESGHFTIL